VPADRRGASRMTLINPREGWRVVADEVGFIVLKLRWRLNTIKGSGNVSANLAGLNLGPYVRFGSMAYRRQNDVHGWKADISPLSTLV